ncbi:class I lanthipeptide [Aquimarina sp. W85]|uniref:class I lanthipeptide n=1 Tax=Aquimarina rhodophyticola TaxID=3342246 RepID=UPI00366C4FF6
MKKLILNKETISKMDTIEMASVNGGLLGICLKSCKNGSRRGKSCCDDDSLDGDYDDDTIYV